VQFQPSGKIIERPAVGFEQTSSRVLGQPYAAPVLIDIPRAPRASRCGSSSSQVAIARPVK
jgi:hypothetical protein